MAEDQHLKYKIVKNESDDSGITIPGASENNITHQFVINEGNLFQRFRVFSNGLIVSEEIINGQRIFRSNRPL